MDVKQIKQALVVFVGILFLVPVSVKAVNTDTLGILPAYPDLSIKYSNAWFLYNLGLGDERNDAVKVINNTEETIVVKLYPVDADTTADGSFALLPEDSERKDISSWIKLSLNEVEVPPNSMKIVPFHIKVPENADVGDHQGGIIMQEIETDSSKLAGTGVKIITRVGVRMYETVPGEIKKKFSLTRFDWLMTPTGKKILWKDILDLNKKTVFLVGIKNEGNAKISPRIDLDVYNIFGQQVVHLPEREVGEVFPREENTESQVVWDGMPWAGRYKVRINVKTLEGAEPQSKELIIWAVPYRVIFFAILLSVIGFLIQLIFRYFHEVSKEKMPIYQVPPGESLTALSEKLMVNWKVVAKLNDLQPPYELRLGKKLFIPPNKKNKILLKELRAQGIILPSIAERRGSLGMGKKVAIAAVILILVGVSTVYGIRKRKDKKVHEEYQTPPSQQQVQEEQKETDEKTASGAFKKSSVKVSLASNAADPESNRRLKFKLALIGYVIDEKPMQANKYAVTTIEYKPDKKEKAEMLKKDLGVPGQAVEMVENPALAEDALIYNVTDKDVFYNFDKPLEELIQKPEFIEPEQPPAPPADQTNNGQNPPGQ